MFDQENDLTVNKHPICVLTIARLNDYRRIYEFLNKLTFEYNGGLLEFGCGVQNLVENTD